MPKKRIKPFHDVLLRLNKPLAETIKMGNLELYLDPSWHPEQHVTVTGTVVSIPDNNPYGKELKRGQEVCFSYQVVADRDFADEPSNFHPYVNEENLQIFYNGHMEKIQVRAVQGAITKRFVCCFFDKKGEFIHGLDGLFSEKERWLSQFKFGDVQKFKFSNCIELDGELLWKCSFDQIFAKKVGNKLVAIGDRVIMKPIKVDVTKEMLSETGIDIPLSAINATLAAGGRVESAPAGIPLKKGDKIGFPSSYVEKYQFYGKDYLLINKNVIMGVWN